MIKHVTYPDNFMQEQETTIAQIVQLAADKDVKAIVICQAVPERWLPSGESGICAPT